MDGFVFADVDCGLVPSEGIEVIRLNEYYGPLSPILHTVPMQLLAYHAALARGTDIDKPRNLAKSVTVEEAESAIRVGHDVAPPPCAAASPATMLRPSPPRQLTNITRQAADRDPRPGTSQFREIDRLAAGEPANGRRLFPAQRLPQQTHYFEKLSFFNNTAPLARLTSEMDSISRYNLDVLVVMSVGSSLFGSACSTCSVRYGRTPGKSEREPALRLRVRSG